MWEIDILAVGKMKNRSLSDEIKRVASLIKGDWKLSFIEVDSNKKENIIERKRVETKSLLQKIPKESETYFLDKDGKEVDEKEFFKILCEQKERGKKICFVIGGAYGLDKEILREGKKFISLSKLTFSHELIKLMLVEQIYRAYTLYNNIPYAK